jgi:hypothetical protein
MKDMIGWSCSIRGRKEIWEDLEGEKNIGET